MPDIFPPRALPVGCLVSLGATRDVYHGPLVVSRAPVPRPVYRRKRLASGNQYNAPVAAVGWAEAGPVWFLHTRRLIYRCPRTLIVTAVPRGFPMLRTAGILVVKPARPVSLSLSPTKFRWPVTAMASIAHRLTGVGLFAGFAWLLYLLDLALGSAAGFDRAQALLAGSGAKFALLGVLALLAYHLFAGIRHLLLDLHVGDSLIAARRASWLVFALTAVAVLALGAWLW